MTTTKYVALLDILGFTDLINNNSIEVIRDIYDQTILKVTKGLIPKSTDIVVEMRLNSVIVSDTILIWTEDDSLNALTALVMTVSTILHISLAFGIPLRGAITKGPLIVIETGKTTNVIGKAITDAYKLEKRQQWSGCMIESNIIDSYTENDLKYIYGIDNFIIKYNVPFRSGKVTEEYVVNWVRVGSTSRTLLNYSYLLEVFSDYNKNIEDWEVKQKINNTYEYIKYIHKETTP